MRAAAAGPPGCYFFRFRRLSCDLARASAISAASAASCSSSLRPRSWRRWFCLDQFVNRPLPLRLVGFPPGHSGDTLPPRCRRGNGGLSCPHGEEGDRREAGSGGPSALLDTRVIYCGDCPGAFHRRTGRIIKPLTVRETPQAGSTCRRCDRQRIVPCALPISSSRTSNPSSRSGKRSPAASPRGPKMDSLALRDHAEDILLATARDMQSAQSATERSAKSRGHGRPRRRRHGA